jgi:hypothetical protein
MEQIEKEYDGNFVCIANCKIGEYHDILGGEVIAVSKNKMEVQEVWGKNPESYYRWMGEFPDDMRYLLL